MDEEDTFTCDQCGQEFPCDEELNYYTDEDGYILTLCFDCYERIGDCVEE